VSVHRADARAGDGAASRRRAARDLDRRFGRRIMAEDYSVRAGDDVSTNAARLFALGIAHPKHPYRIGWDLFVGVLIVFSVCVVPYRIGFDLDARGVWLWADVAIDLIFGVDILVNFRTTFADSDGAYVTDARRLAGRYLRGWFAVDFASTVPVDRLLPLLSRGADGDGARSLKVVRILRLFRLVKLVRLLKLKRVVQTNRLIELPPVLGAFAKNCVLLLFLSHLYACLWWWGAERTEDGEGRLIVEPESWIQRFCVGREGFEWCLSDRVSPREEHMPVRWLASAYWVYATFATVGYGEVSATFVSESELMVSILGMCVGSIVFAMFISSVYSLVAAHTSSSPESDELSRLKAYMSARRVPKRLQAAVRAQLRHRTLALRGGGGYDETAIHAEMPSNLAARVVRHVHRDPRTEAERRAARRAARLGGPARSGAGDASPAEESDRGDDAPPATELETRGESADGPSAAHRFGLLRCPIFAQLEEEMPGAIVELARLFELPAFVEPGDAVFLRGESQPYVFFVVHGEISVVDADARVVARLGPGDWFGESALAIEEGTAWRHRYSGFCSLGAPLTCVYTIYSHSLASLSVQCSALHDRILELLDPTARLDDWIEVLRRDGTG
jgi:hypothetical protein